MYIVCYRKKNDDYLIHYGVKGMKWGVRRSKKLSSTGKNIMKLNLQFFAKRSKALKTIKLSAKEYAHVMHEINTNINDSQKKSPIFNKPIGEHIYTVENHFDGTYRVIGKKKIPKSLTGILERDKNVKK